MTFPNLSAAKAIGVDTETYDPTLKEDGPGWGRGSGYVLGVSLATDSNDGWYIEVGEHPDPQVIAYLKDTLGTSIPKVGANLQYDYGWLATLGIFPQGVPYDIQFAEALLDDNMLHPKSVSLDYLAQQYLGIRKNSQELEAYTKERWPWQKDFRENLWRVPADLVAKYAISDAQQPLQVLKQQWPALRREGLLDVFQMECKLIPLLVAMRMRGVRVDLLAASEARDDMLLAEQLMTTALNNKAGRTVNVNSSKDLAVLFDSMKASYPRTAKGNPSFTADWLKVNEQPIAQEVLKLRQLIKMRSTFVENAILEKAVSSRLHPSLHPLRSDDSGTISGRFSSSQPNSQQLPKRNKQWAPIIRGLFVPDAGYPSWLSLDLSQIEYRLFAHFAGDPELTAAYQDPAADFHSIVSNWLGDDLPRIIAKTVNFGLLYGMGRGKLTAQIAALLTDVADPKKRAAEIYDRYNATIPAAKATLSKYSQMAEKPPHEVQTILGRKSRFVLWESVKSIDEPPKPFHEAKQKWGNIRVAGTYKAINRVLQGSAADLLKKAMLNAWESGLFSKIGVPHLSIHDELCFSYHPDLEQEFKQMKWHMENAVKLSVPVIANASIGPTWGSVEEVDW